MVRPVGAGGRQRRWFGLVSLALNLLDIPTIYLALCLSYWLRFNADMFVTPAGVPPFSTYQRSFLIVAVLWYLFFALAGLYGTRARFGAGHVLDIVRTVLLATGAVLVGVFFYRDFSYSRLTVMIAVVVATTAVCVFHYLKAQLLLWMARSGYCVQRVLVVGGGKLGLDCFSRLEAESAEVGYELVGFCSDTEVSPDSKPSLGRLEQVTEIIESAAIDVVFLALAPEQSRRSMELLRFIEPMGVQIKIVPNIFSVITSSIKITELAGMPVVNLSPLPIHRWGGAVKGVFDRSLALLGLIALSPFLLLVALKIRMDSPGSVIYSQERVGLDGTPFTIFKFRSMRLDAEDTTGPVWAVQGDSRVTPFGAFLRKYSIDELPQLYNVVLGNMSLVGPRPERPFFVEKFNQRIPHYMARHVVKTGITGWAQVNGLRGQCPIEERTRYDIWYIENWSLWLDLVILVRTVYVCVFKPTGF